MDVFDFFLYLAYFMAITAALIAPLLAVLTSLGEKKALLKTGIGILGIGVLYLIAYLLSGNEVTTGYAQFNIGPDMSKVIGGALIMAYLLSGIIFISLIYTEIVKSFK